jgi:anaerobic magnesium-protoporphyrin IX monomethyl ester cyclase
MSFKRVMLVRPSARCGWGFLWSPLAINLEYIAATILNDVDEVQIVNQEFDETPIEQHLKEFNPDLLGVTMSATEHSPGLEILKHAKKLDKNLRTIVGGFHPTAVPELMMSFDQVDMVGFGEAEMTMLELVKKGTPEGVQGTIYKNKKNKIIYNDRRPVVKDLDSLPFPARHLRVGDECDLGLEKFGLHRDQIHTSRGCFGRCTFCCEPNMSKSKQRFRQPEKVMEEIQEIWKLHHEEPMFILLGDPHFMGKPKNVDRLCDLLIDADLDIEFTAMVRADKIARYPEISRKMVEAGIIGFCMGMESPSEGDLSLTKKGISNEAQYNAVRNLRKAYGSPGGTFVCGLPEHTEEEILMFPEYARRLGMTNAAFPVATPHAATEFYIGLDNQGLINEGDWGKYDQMHLVFKHDKLSRQRCEELLTHCLGRFYALDIFLDDMIAVQHRQKEGRKKSFRGAIAHFLDRMYFVQDASKEYETIENGTKMGSIFLGGQVNPHTKNRTQRIGIHNVVDLSRILSIIGDQKFCITVRHKGKPFAYYVLKTSKDKVHYLDITDKPHKNITIGITLDIEHVTGKRRSKAWIATRMFKRILVSSKWSALVKSMVAIMADQLQNGRAKDSSEKMNLPSDFFEHFCESDDWDPIKYRTIQKKNAV